MGANDKVAATFHPFDPGPAMASLLRPYVERVVGLVKMSWHLYQDAVLARQRELAAMPPGLAQAVTEWDRALDDAEGIYSDALDDLRTSWHQWERYAMTERMHAALDLGLTREGALERAGRVIALRFQRDLTLEQAAQVAVAILEGYASRLRHEPRQELVRDSY